MRLKARPLVGGLLALAMLTFACGGDSDKTPDDISAVADNFARVTSFKATINRSGGNANISSAIEYQQPDLIKMAVVNGATTQELICIGSDLYLRVNTTAWQKAPASAGAGCSSSLGPADPKTLSDGIRTAAADQTMTRSGRETVKGKKCQVYTQTQPNGARFEMCVAGGLPQRIVSNTGDQSITITFSEFNKNIDIKAPI